VTALYTQDDVRQLIRDSVKGLLDARREIGRNAFTDDDRDYGAAGKVGVAASLQGIRTVLNALSALEDDPAIWEAVSGHLPSLIDEWVHCMSEVKEGEYTSAPYAHETLRDLFGEATCEYIDTVSWVLSTAVLVNYMLREGGALDRYTWAIRLREQGILSQTREALHESLARLLDAQCQDGGWTWRAGESAQEDGTPADAGDLFFTWAALGGLADVDDYVLGASEVEIGIEPDRATIAFLRSRDPKLVSRIAGAREQASAFLTGPLQNAKARGLTKDDVSRKTPSGVSLEVVVNDPLVLTYYEMYLLESLLLAGYDQPGGDRDESRARELAQLYLRIDDKIDQLGAESFDGDAALSTLEFVIKRGRQNFPVLDGGLWPQLLRTMSLYRTYVDVNSGDDAPIIGRGSGSALDYLVRHRRGTDVPHPGTWDDTAFNLAITSRCIEGLVDCYDFFSVMKDAGTHAASGAGGALADSIAEAVYPLLKQRMMDDLKAKLPTLVRAEIDASSAAKATGEAEATPQLTSEEVERLVRIAMKREGPAVLLATLDDAVFNDYCFPQRSQLTREVVMQRMLPRRNMERLKEDSPDGYAVLEAMTWLGFHLGVRLGPYILQEELVESQEKEKRESFRQLNGDGDDALATRLRQGLRRLSDVEVSAMHRQVDERPDYEALVKALLPHLDPKSG